MQLTGGLEVDTTQPTWATTFNQLWATATASAYSYVLTGPPVATSFTVTVNGVRSRRPARGAASVDYNPTTNAVVFYPRRAQAGRRRRRHLLGALRQLTVRGCAPT